MAALTVISYMADRNKKGNLDGSLLKLTQSEEDRHRETKHQLQRKIQHSQLIKMRQQQEHRKKLQSRLGTDGGLGGDTHNLERSRSVPADRLFSDSDSTSSSNEGANTEGKEITPSEIASTPQQQTVASGVKDSPNKRRYTPIQPKTPVRDNNAIKAVPITIPGLAKGQQSQFFLLRNPNGTARFATEVIRNGQKVLQLLDSPPIIPQPAKPNAAPSKPNAATNKPNANVVCSKAPTPVVSTSVAAPANTKPMSQIVLVRQAPNQSLVTQGGVKAGSVVQANMSKTENIANAAILVSPNHHVLVSPVKTPVNSQTTSLVSAPLAAQIVSSGGHIMVQGTPIQQTGQGQAALGKTVSPASQQTPGVVSVVSPTVRSSTAQSNQVTIKKEVVSRGPTPSVEMSLASPTSTTASITNYVRAIVRLASPVSEVQQAGSHPTSAALVTTQTLKTVTTDSITSPQSTPICLPGMSANSIPHTISAAALLKSLSSTVNSNNQQQVTPQQSSVQVPMQKPPQPHQALPKQSVASTAGHAKAPLTEIHDSTAQQLHQVAATLQQHPQILQQQQNLSAAKSESVLVSTAVSPSSGTASNQLQQAGGILKTALMSPLPPSSSTQHLSVQMTSSALNQQSGQTILSSTSDAVARFDALQLHDNTIGQIQGEHPTGVLSLQMTGNQHPGFIPVSGVKRLAVDPKSATVLTNNTAISLDSIQQQQQQLQQKQQLTTVLSSPAGVNQGSTNGQTIINQTILNTSSTAYPLNLVKSKDGTVSIIPVSQLSQGVISQQIVNQTVPSVRSVPCTPTSGMQSPVPMTLTINGHVTPVMQQATGGTTTPVPMSVGSVPPSPVAPMSIGSVPPSPVAVDVSSGFIPIQQGIDQSRIASNASPVKRTKVKPRPTHPKQQGAEFTSQQGISLQESTGHFQHAEIASKPNFAAPTRKRRPSGQRRVNANPYPLPPPVPRQTTPVASPCGSRCNTPVSPANLDSISMPPPSPGLPPFDGTVMGGSRQNSQDLRNRSASPALWNAAATSGRRRNPSGPPTYTMQPVTRQHSLDATTYNQTEINNLNQVFIDHKGIATRLPQVSQRSQSVPLPDLPEEARILNFQLQQQQLTAAVQQASTNMSQLQQTVTSLSQSSNEIVTQDRVLTESLSGTELRGIQINNTCSNYNAKRNLTLELQEIEVTEDDFAPTHPPTQNFLSPEQSNSQSAGGTLDAFMLTPSQQADQTQEVNQGSSWSTSRGGDPTLASAPVGSSDLNVGFDMASSDQAVSTPGGTGLQEDQGLLFSQAMNGDASNSTSSTLNDDIPNMEDPLADFGPGTSFDLSWQMGSNSSLSTLECGM